MKIGLCGTVSVGKTTLVKALAELPQFQDYKIATERSKYLRDLGIPLNTDSTMKGQTVFLAERISELMYEDVLTDRTIIDVMAFTECSSTINQADKNKFRIYTSSFIKEYDYIFYISPKGVEIEDNGIRETDSLYRTKIDNTITSILNIYEHECHNVHTISGTTEERVKIILEILSL
jgi:GTPase SAR1 family protein